VNAGPGFFDSLTATSVLHATWVTIWISLAAQGIAVVIGLVFGPMRSSRIWPLRAVSWFYVWFFRGSPELMQIIAWYAILPLLGLNLTLIEAGLLGLSINEGARMCEIVRAALSSVDQGQIDAARTLGMRRSTAFRLVILPQAVKLIIPPLGNQMNYMFKTSSLVSVIGIVELLRNTELLTQTATKPLSVYLATCVIYLLITTAWGLLQRLAEHLTATGGAVTPAARGRGFSVARWFPLVGENL
jgi:polar amino acid transport system permease protein